MTGTGLRESAHIRTIPPNNSSILEAKGGGLVNPPRDRPLANGRHPYEFDGLYLPFEVARYLAVSMPTPPKRRLRSRRVLSWIREGLLAPTQRDVPGQLLVMDFDDLVSCQVITLLRELGFSLQQIRHD